jgi:hypothetical protein
VNIMPNHRRSAATLAAFCLGFLALASRAAAGPVEQLVQVAMHPSDPNMMLVRYIHGGDGMLRTRDGGKTWQLACDSMSLPPQTQSGPMAIAGDGTTWMGVFDGLWHDDAHGCKWSSQPEYDGEWLGDVTQHPTDPGVIFAVTSSGHNKRNGVLRRDANGIWSDFGTKQEMLATGLRVAQHGAGLRLYVGAVEGQITPDAGGTTRPNYVTRVSDDDGQTWQEFALGAVDGTFRLQAIDPTNPDRIVATISRDADSGGSADSDDSVLVSSDRGEHFAEYMKLTEIGGVAFAPDGRVWIGDLGDPMHPMQAPGGVWFAANLDATPVRLAMATYPVQCLGYNRANDTLYACQHFAFGTVDAQSGAFSSLIKLTEVSDFVQCDGVDSAAACEMQLCSAYCGFGHFARAPMCQAYDTDTCGVPVAAMEWAELGASADAGTRAAGDAGTDAGLVASSASLKGQDLHADKSKTLPNDSGCSVASPGAREAHAPLRAFAFLLLTFIGCSLRRQPAG